MNQILYSGKTDKNPVIFIVIGILIIIIIGLVLFGFGILNLWNHKILKGVIAANVNVSEMTKEEAEEAIAAIYEEEMIRSLDLTYDGKTITVSTDEIGYHHTSAEEMAEKAYGYGRDGNIVQNNFTVMKSYFHGEKVLETEKLLDKDILMARVNELMQEDREFSHDDFYYVSGDQLVMTKGTEGRKVDFDVLEERILTALQENQMVVEMPFVVSEPQAIDIDKMYADVVKEPVNASYTTGEKFEIIKEENGISFDKEEARKQYQALSSGETATIALMITEPEIKLDSLQDVLFRTMIATYSTKYTTSNKTETTMIQSAAEKVNQVVLYPGDEFSYGKIVGGEATQVASTLYNAVLRADLKVEKRTAPTNYVSFVPQSTDAMVNEETDLVFKNERKYPVKLEAISENGTLTVSIYGYKEENEPRVEVETKVLENVSYATETEYDASLSKGTKRVTQQGMNGYVSEAYKVYYDNDGKETSRLLVSKDTYEPVKEVVRVGTKTVTPTPEPVTPSVTPSTGPALPPGWDNPESGY